MSNPLTDMYDAAPWAGRFPRNEIISLLDVNRPFNLAESTAQDLTIGEVLALTDRDALDGIKLGYGSSTGLLGLREEIARVCDVSPDCVITTQGTALSLFMLAFELCRPGDEVVLSTPCFPPSRDALVGCGAVLREVPSAFEQGYRIDPDRIASALSAKTRLVSIATPQNPSGVATDRATIAAILDRMSRLAPAALLFIDETYRAASYGDEATPASFASLDPRIITGASISKAHGAPGLRVGWMTVADADLRERLTVAKMNIVISGSVLDETLALAILRASENLLAPRRLLLARALDTLSAWQVRESERVQWVRPHGGALCCMRLAPAVFDEMAVDRFWAVLPNLDLQLASGSWFGETARVFRLGFGYLPEEGLGPALAAMSDALDAALKAGTD